MLLLRIPEVFGISIEVYLIVLVLFALHFFAIRWLLRKRVADTKRRGVIAGLISLVVAPVVYVGIMLLVIAGMTSYPHRDFDKAAWDADVEKRYEYADDLLESDQLIGLDHTQVIALLGEPSDASAGQMNYYLGFSPRSLFAIDPDHLAIVFAGERVQRVYIFNS